MGPIYTVVVNGLGTVYTGCRRDAHVKYSFYVSLSKSKCGRCGNLDVTLCRDGEPIKEHSALQEYARTVQK